MDYYMYWFLFQFVQSKSTPLCRFVSYTVDLYMFDCQAIALFIMPHMTARRCCKSSQSSYVARWAVPQFFDDVIVSDGMLSDHVPNNVQWALDVLAETAQQIQVVNVI